MIDHVFFDAGKERNGKGGGDGIGGGIGDGGDAFMKGQISIVSVFRILECIHGIVVVNSTHTWHD